MQNQNEMITALSATDIDNVAGGALPLAPIIWAGVRAAVTSSTGQKLAAGAFAAAVTVASGVLDGE